MDYSGDSQRFSWIAAACISFYGLGSWIVVIGVWVELPVLVNYLPEGWNLPAYLSVLIQIANLGPLIYVPLTKLCRTPGHSFWSRCLQPPERLANYTILIVGLLSCVLLAHLWNVVGPLPGKTNTTHSIGLLVLALFAAVVDCTSSVTFVAYLSGLPETYVGALTFGEAFSDLLPSLIALIQGIGEAPKCVNTTAIVRPCVFNRIRPIAHGHEHHTGIIHSTRKRKCVADPNLIDVLVSTVSPYPEGTAVFQDTGTRAFYAET
ncbi:hypothetical protein EG68_11399 [Paragonimus skrjabini miyazakii]|uniref:Riboflavin transporter n=1 Tax=Paragonimus skrjabini miyazakii TaxID=59628 RepID=A0A8S9Y8M0_9TREM|nr:hypothetical protein EG68_11399 [Paragonimus skrjabini miyazakii]